MTRPRIIIPISIQFSVRYILRTGLLKQISQFYQPVIVLGWEDECLASELIAMGCDVIPMPKAQMAKGFARLRKQIHRAHFDHIASCSTQIDRRRNKLLSQSNFPVRAVIRDLIYSMGAKIPGRFSALCQMEAQRLMAETNLNDYLKLVQEVRPDVFFCLTPYFIEEEFLSRAAMQMNVKTCTAILSFDNLTTRPRIPIIFDKYLLWNAINKNELFRIYPETLKKDVQIVGSPQFDFYFDQDYIWPESIWRANLGLPLDRPVILFGAGLEIIAPAEPHIVAQLDAAIRDRKIPNNPIIVLRLHPLDSLDRWENIRRKATNVVFDLAWPAGKVIAGKTNVARKDIEKLASTLKHSQVHINTSSTMTVDGAIFDRPQIGPAYDDRPGRTFDRIMRELYLREHYLPITNSGGLQIAYSTEQLIEQVNEAFVYPNRHREGRQKLVRAIATFADGNSTTRVVAALTDCLKFDSIKLT